MIRPASAVPGLELRPPRVLRVVSSAVSAWPARGFTVSKPSTVRPFLLLFAALLLLIASSLVWRGYVRMIDETRAELVGVEAGE